MIDREIGRMQVENETVLFIERRVAKEDLDNFWRSLNMTAVTYTDQEVVSEWVALMNVGAIENVMIGYGNLERTPLAQTCHAYIAVHQDHRGFGVGKFMARLITDLAIWHRQRVVLCAIAPDNTAARALADMEDFHPDDQSQDGFRKELQWRG